MMKKNLKKIAAGALVLSMVATMPTTALAKEDGTNLTAQTAGQGAKKQKTEESKKAKPKAQEVAKITCTSAGKVNVSFKQKVTYTDDLNAVIRDVDGKEISCKISKKNKRLLTVSVSGLVKGQKYTLEIEGILGKDSTQAVDVKKTFTAKGMKTQSKVGKATVSNKKFVVLKMKSAAYYKDASVSVVDGDGQSCDAKIVKKAKGNIKVQISNMKKGNKYTITISGVKTKKEKNYGSITKTVVVK